MNAPPAALLDARYRLGPVIARGGMSTVYRGTDTRLDRPVAVKIMEPRLAADPAFRRRFEREARSAARIHHPAVVGVYDQGEDHHGNEPTVFLVMELVDGATLRDLLRGRGPLGVPTAIAVLEPVLAGLAPAHRLGLVHRDVKPENVLISHEGAVKVADFGLVVAAAQAGASHIGMIMGTVAYLSPEQVATGTADARSDVYAAGVLLYELLTGTPPFVGDTAISVAFRHVTDRVPAPSLVAGDVPPELDALVLRATDREPDRRPADAAALLAELRDVARTLEVPRLPVPAAPRPAVEQDTERSAGGASIDTVPSARRAPAPSAVPGQRGTRALPAPIDRPGRIPAARIPARRGDDRRSDGGRGARPARRRGLVTGIVLAVVLALVLAAGGWWWGAGRFTEVPQLAGLPEARAATLVTQAGLALASDVRRVADDAAPVGNVLSTDPGPGGRVLRGDVVTLTVSSGRPVVPAVAPGTAPEDAEQLVRDAGLDPVRTAATAEFSSTVPAGAVVRTDPGAGTAVAIGGDVTLVVSRGPEPPPAPEQVAVPLVIGRPFEQAEEILEDLGLEVEQRDTLDFGRRDRDRSTVIGQSPGGGATVDEGSTVVLDTL